MEVLGPCLSHVAGQGGGRGDDVSGLLRRTVVVGSGSRGVKGKGVVAGGEQGWATDHDVLNCHVPRCSETEAPRLLEM